MHFCDEAIISVKAGNGGNGSASFRREKFVPKGGPDGGNGGEGGSVIFEASTNRNTLVSFMSRKHYKAEDGGMGKGRNKAGAKGLDMILKVPIGTLVYNQITGEKIADLSRANGQMVVARGGRGGKGNANFVSSVRQAPDFAELGEPGEEKELRLELKLIADVALVGYPNVGKSTLISRISNAKPKIADYPFTTLVPHLGVVQVDDTDFVVADIPGLIEGAHEGKGLGVDFLKHIERTSIVVHLLDATRDDLKQDYKAIQKELKSFSAELIKKPQILVVNKSDAAQAEIMEQAAKTFKKEKPLFISAVSGKGVQELLYKLKDAVLKSQQQKKTVQAPAAKTSAILRPHLNLSGTEQYEITRETDGFRITGKRIEQIAIMTNPDSRGGVRRLHDILKKIGAYREMKKMGGKLEDAIHIGPRRFEFVDMD